MSEPFISYAQNGEDVLLWRALGHVRDGRYVDVGACEPEDLSVTKALYDRGWRGIDIEPVPAYADLLRDARPGNEIVQAAITDEPVESIVLHQVVGTALSTLDEATAAFAVASYPELETQDVVVPVRTLNSVCEESSLLGGELHLLKVDVEGSEAPVLRSISLDRWLPWVVIVESTLPSTDTPSHHSWEHLLSEAGYQFTLFDGLNRFYISKHHPELYQSLSYPACVIDNFTRAREVHLEGQLESARQEIFHLRDAAQRLSADSAAEIGRLKGEARVLRKKLERVKAALAKTKAKLEASRRRNRRLKERLARLDSHLEVRMRHRVARTLRRLQGSAK